MFPVHPKQELGAQGAPGQIHIYMVLNDTSPKWGGKRMGWQKKEGSQGCSGPLRAHLWLLLLAQLPEQGDLLLVPGHDTQDLVPAGRQRGHREGTGLEGS